MRHTALAMLATAALALAARTRAPVSQTPAPAERLYLPLTFLLGTDG